MTKATKLLTDEDAQADLDGTPRVSALAAKRADFCHSDSGYTLALLDENGVAPLERQVKGLKGLITKVKELQEAGYEVSVQGEVVE